MRDYLIARVMKEIPYTRLNGHPTERLSNNANFAFQFIEGESLLIMLDMDGICGSSGSACTSGSLDPSHVLLAIGLPHEIAHGSLRLTLNDEITKDQMTIPWRASKRLWRDCAPCPRSTRTLSSIRDSGGRNRQPGNRPVRHGLAKLLWP